MTNANGLPSGQVLDMVLAPQDASQDSYDLREILAAMGLKARMRSFEVLAKDLSRAAGREIPWTKKYVHSVYKGHIQASAEFSRAIQKLAQMVDGVPAGAAGTSFVRVLADASRIPEGALIPKSARVLKCARPGCPVWFVRVHGRQIYHDAECRKRRVVDGRL